ncbi:hypothetical protein ACFXDE_01820 [Kitasatospora sp. NPDC059408]|uniref:hypothetical protein n=1 Tax=Kitasatospora sp. NPDC059408 TaxID=3346823 RepID=UPI00369AF814
MSSRGTEPPVDPAEFTVIRTDPVHEIAAERGTLTRFGRLYPEGPNPSWGAVHVAVLLGYRIPLVEDPALRSGEIHLRPTPPTVPFSQTPAEERP